MGEYSINVNHSNKNLVKFLYSAVKRFTSDCNGLVAVNEQNNYSSILIGVEESYKERLQTFLSKCITKSICSFYKNDFLNKNLSLPLNDELLALAFRYAMINFDKETDYYIITRNIEFNKEIYLDSFYNFKLKKLQAKWKELINLANDNREFLLDKSAFMDLLKFLIDNIDISTNEIDIVENEEGYRIFTSQEEEILEIGNNEDLVKTVIDLSPQKMNIYCNNVNRTIDLLSFMFEKRANIYLNKRVDEEALTFLRK